MLHFFVSRFLYSGDISTAALPLVTVSLNLKATGTHTETLTLEDNEFEASQKAISLPEEVNNFTVNVDTKQITKIKVVGKTEWIVTIMSSITA